MIERKEMLDAVNENFERYAGNVILDRAICDARDMLKPSARMLIYSQLHESKNIPSKPFIKSARIVGDCLGHYYEHGDQSCYGTYMRMAKPFSMRVPLEDCQGNSGTLITTSDEASMRYTELRLAQISQYLYDGIEKNAIGEEWRYNFDQTEKYPSVMPSIGYYNICNGTIGLGIAISSSIPQFNLKEVNSSIIKLIKNPETPDEDVVIMPDFATGAMLINEDDVKESLINGVGKACKLRAKIEYHPDGNYLHISELPYSVFTETITNELRAILEENERYGIESINDGTGKTPDYNIYLSKGVNPRKMIAKLYKDTSLESFFPIGMWVLDKGRYPKIMGLKQLFLSYIDHIRKCKRNEVEFDLNKATARKNIVEGLIEASKNIDSIVATIKMSDTFDMAVQALVNDFGFNEEQAKAILGIKLSSLTKLDSAKLEEENENLRKAIEEYNEILSNPALLDEKLIQILQEVSKKFGDERRTKIVNITETDDEKVEEEPRTVFLFDNHMFRIVKSEEVGTGKKGRKGISVKPPKGATLISTIHTTNFSSISCFSTNGRMYTFSIENLDCDFDYSLNEVITPKTAEEEIIAMIDSSDFYDNKFIVFVMKSGLVKKTETSAYTTQSSKGTICVRLKDDDKIVGIFFSNDEEDEIFVGASNGIGAYFSLNGVAAQGKNSMGVKGITLNDGCFVVSSTIVRKDELYKGILTITSGGKGKITNLSEFSPTNRGVKGITVHKLNKNEQLSIIYAVPESQDKINVFANSKLVSVQIDEIPFHARRTNGVKIIKVDEEKKNEIKIINS